MPGEIALCVSGGGAGCTGALCTGSVACVCSCKSNVRTLSEAVASRCPGSNPNIAIKNLHGVAGKPPISKRPSRSVTVVILSLPHSAITVAPGIGCPPERTTPFCTAALPSAAENKTTHVKRSIDGPFCYSHNTRLAVSPFLLSPIRLIKIVIDSAKVPVFTELYAGRSYMAFLSVKVAGPPRPSTSRVISMVSPFTMPL